MTRLGRLQDHPWSRTLLRLSPQDSPSSSRIRTSLYRGIPLYLEFKKKQKWKTAPPELRQSRTLLYPLELLSWPFSQYHLDLTLIPPCHPQVVEGTLLVVLICSGSQPPTTEHPLLLSTEGGCREPGLLPSNSFRVSQGSVETTDVAVNYSSSFAINKPATRRKRFHCSVSSTTWSFS